MLESLEDPLMEIVCSRKGVHPDINPKLTFKREDAEKESLRGNVSWLLLTPLQKVQLVVSLMDNPTCFNKKNDSVPRSATKQP